MNYKKELRQLKFKNFFFLTIAGIINSIGVTMFIAPVNLYDSGISGTSILLSQVSGLGLSLFLILLNLPLFFIGFRKQGLAFTIYATYAVMIYSIGAWLITDILPVDVSMASPLAGSDLLLCALFGGMISGAGSGLAIRFGGAMDGIEVLAVMLAKKLGITVGTFVMGYNVILYICCGFVLESWILPLYSIVTYAAALKTVDFIVEGLDHSKAAFIITERCEAICKALSEEFGTGMTIMDAKGYFSRSHKYVVYFVVNRFQVNKMQNIVREIDPMAFISINEIADVLGKSVEE